ncbi:GNAT family N-acetyltransferase [Paenibacillus polygoni]|uniref:GNAT family N-acetyltransferase n=1 Tax=Paenibacillus polygoni TaxID=3050112 RepID=A0ABY8X774_9BACL|nr:GNAT family N-acetyltransferase [Paenibacillus polygoni]WIV20322.1 GNAT family N-acetyltransferase [Paenibacillus polygoni]
MKTSETSNSSIVIRSASLSEAPIILNLWQNSAKWLNSKGIYQWRPEFFNVDQVIEFLTNGSDVYIAELNSEAVGTYIITWSDPYIWGELDNNDSGYIHRFAVNRDYIGKKIGYTLLKTAEQQIKTKGKTFVRLDCMAANNKLNAYYQDYGFNYIRTINGEGWSANLYEKQ